MIRYSLRLFIIIVSFGVLASPFCRYSWAEAGVRDGGGGDAAELEFISIGRGLLAAIQTTSSAVQFQVDLARFDEALKKTTVSMVRTALEVPTGGLTQSFRERDALNFPTQNKILVNRPRWTTFKPSAKVELVFHEYLGIMGVEWNTYEVSSRLRNILGVNRLSQIAAAAEPQVIYQCVVKMCDAENCASPSTCGEAVLSTVRSSSAPSQVYFSKCGLSLGIYETERAISLSILEPGLDSQWMSRTPEYVSSYNYDIYETPRNFALSLLVTRKGFFKNTALQYRASCFKRDSDYVHE